MKNLWFDRFKGIVLLYVKGEKAVDFLNAAVQKQIKVWSIRKVDEECIGFFILISDISQLRNLRRDYHVQFSFGKREGLWFHWQRVKKKMVHLYWEDSCLSCLSLCFPTRFGKLKLQVRLKKLNIGL